MLETCGIIVLSTKINPIRTSSLVITSQAVRLSELITMWNKLQFFACIIAIPLKLSVFPLLPPQKQKTKNKTKTKTKTKKCKNKQ